MSCAVCDRSRLSRDVRQLSDKSPSSVILGSRAISSRVKLFVNRGAPENVCRAAKYISLLAVVLDARQGRHHD